MSNSFKSKADMLRMLGDVRAPNIATVIPEKRTGLSASDVQNAIGVQVGKLDLGFLGNLKAERHRRREEGAMQMNLTSHQVNKATELLREKIDGEVEILRMHFKQDFSDRIAALAESAAASQTLVIRKLKAVESEARKYLFYDLKRELDDLQEMMVSGVIDMQDFQTEAKFRLDSYERLKEDFVAMFSGYRGAIQNAYRSSGQH